MKKIACCFVIVLVTCAQTIFSQSANIEFDKTSPRQQYAASQIKYLPDNYHINLKVDPDSFLPESYAIKLTGRIFTISGGDERGLIYGCLSLAEDLRNGVALRGYRAKAESPYLPFRAIKYDLPWDTYRHSYALELHDQTCRDTNYWK